MEAAKDLTLARQVTDGDERALEAFYPRYADPLFAFIYHHIDESHPDAEDVWQETLLAAINALPAYRGGRGGPAAGQELQGDRVAALASPGRLPGDVGTFGD